MCASSMFDDATTLVARPPNPLSSYGQPPLFPPFRRRAILEESKSARKPLCLWLPATQVAVTPEVESEHNRRQRLAQR